VAGVLLLPSAYALVAFMSGYWRYRAGLETAAELLLGIGGTFALVLLVRNRWPEARRTRSIAFWRVDIVKHRLVFGVLFLVFTGYGLWTAARNIGDWIVPPETREVVIVGSSVSHRSGVTSIYTQEGSYRTPWFVGFEFDPGPALLTLGGVSGLVLAVTQRR